VTTNSSLVFDDEPDEHSSGNIAKDYSMAGCRHNWIVLKAGSAPWAEVYGFRMLLVNLVNFFFLNQWSFFYNSRALFKRTFWLLSLVYRRDIKSTIKPHQKWYQFHETPSQNGPNWGPAVRPCLSLSTTYLNRQTNRILPLYMRMV